MIYFSIDTDYEIPVGTGVQKTETGIEEHSTGQCIGFIRANFPLTTGFRAQVYVAGGGGSHMILGADWDGLVTRFQIQNGQVNPVESGGDGWLLPEYPTQAKTQGDIVQGALYK